MIVTPSLAELEAAVREGYMSAIRGDMSSQRRLREAGSALSLLVARAREMEEALREEATRHHSLRWMLGLDSHEGEGKQSRSDAHRNLDSLLDMPGAGREKPA